MFREGVLVDVHGIGTNLGKIVIAYSERRKSITEGKSTKDRNVRRKLRRLREGRGRSLLLGKLLKIIERLAIENKAMVMIDDICRRVKEEMESRADYKLRYKIH